ncbi:MAG: hypothetical protein LUH12_07570 [Bacteroides sp.]|nr:hypothetical protein [Bacteroides sp.]
MSNYALSNYIPQNEFERLKKDYKKQNDSYDKSVIFHAGTGAGFYSELCNMMESILYCYKNKIKFILYADDANFTGGNGWTELFEEFCEMNHSKLNKTANYRYKTYRRCGKVAVPNLLIKRYFLPQRLKKRENVDLLTQDIFAETFASSFMNSKVQWDLFNISGKVKDEYAKLSPLCFRYNREVKAEIEDRISSLNLPNDYISIQIRGGDKTQEFTNIIGTEYCISKIQECAPDARNIFVFTDDYRNITYMRKKRRDWNIVTLARPDERGYYNDEFNSRDWNERRADLIKLFTMVEICINSHLHIGCAGTGVNLYIKQRRSDKAYEEYQIGEHRKNNLANKIKRVFGV